MRPKLEIPLAEVAARYAAGQTPDAIGLIFKVNGVTIIRRLKELGCYAGYEHRALHIELTPALLEMLDGILLGDGCIAMQRGETSAFLRLDQTLRVSGTDGRPWVREAHAKLEAAGLRCSPLNEDRVIAGRPVLSAHSLSYKELRDQYRRWYKLWPGAGEFAGQPYKIVPSDLSISPLSLAWWFCGDGGGTNHGGLEFATNGFSVDCVERLCTWLRELGFEPATSQNKRKPVKPWVSNLAIRLGREDAYRFGEVVLPHVPPCFKYKLANLHLSDRSSLLPTAPGVVKAARKHARIRRAYAKSYLIPRT